MKMLDSTDLRMRKCAIDPQSSALSKVVPGKYKQNFCSKEVIYLIDNQIGDLVWMVLCDQLQNKMIYNFYAQHIPVILS